LPGPTPSAGIPESACEVGLGETAESLAEHRDGQVVRHDTEPETSALGRFGISVLGLLPIDALL
jgi:putative cardiolipin synthase